MRRLSVAAASCALLLVSGAVHAQRVEPLVIKQARVNGTTIWYVEQGQGLPVVFVHGAISDHRYWEDQREAVAARYRFIAIDRRYFGEAPWPDSGVRVSQERDADDLAAFIRELGIAPAFVVGVSGGGNVSLIMAVRHPDVVRALFLQEPGIRSVVTDSAALRAARQADVARPAREAARAGRMQDAARLFLESANGRHGVFEQLSPALQAMFVHNARVLTLPQMPETVLSCEELGRIRVPVTITKGQLTKPFSVILAEAAHRCIPHSQLVTIPDASHGAPRDNPRAFNVRLLAFIAKNSR